MGYINCRRLVTVGLLFFLILAAFAATSETWTMWATAAALVGAVLISDCMFLDYSQFDFDPEFKNWERRVSPKY